MKEKIYRQVYVGKQTIIQNNSRNRTGDEVLYIGSYEQEPEDIVKNGYELYPGKETRFNCKPSRLKIVILTYDQTYKEV